MLVTCLWRTARPLLLGMVAAVVLIYALIGAVVVHVPADALRSMSSTE